MRIIEGCGLRVALQSDPTEQAINIETFMSYTHPV